MATIRNSAKRIIKLSEVKKHNKPNDIWLVIHNSVYDVSSFQAAHPGGPKVLKFFAGRVATRPFEFIGHSADARDLLKTFKIGDLHPDDIKADVDWAKYAKIGLGTIAIGAVGAYLLRNMV